MSKLKYVLAKKLVLKGSAWLFIVSNECRHLIAVKSGKISFYLNYSLHKIGDWKFNLNVGLGFDAEFNWDK